MIYLDYAATTPLDPRVAAAMRPYESARFGNPSSLHAAGRAARAAMDQARDTVAAFLGARPGEILFTSGGTEADNLAILGVALAHPHGSHLIASAIEHHAVLESCAVLEREGFRVTYLQPDARGCITPAQVEAALTPETILVSVMAANNEIGTIQPIAEIGALCHQYGVLFHTDAVQAAGELRLDVSHLPIDLLSLSAHKLYGPKGVGALYVRAGTPLSPLLHGGRQEMGRRAGTEPVAGIVGFATAVSLVRHEDADSVRALRDSLLAELAVLPGFRLHGDRQQRLAGNLNVAFTGVPGDRLMIALDLHGICVSTGAACVSGSVEPSHVIRALGYSPRQSLEAIRISLGRGITPAAVHTTAACIGELIEQLRD